MYRTVVLVFFLQLFICAQLYLCQTTKKTTKSSIEQYAARGLFATPLCCEAPWKFDPDTARCILDMLAQGVRDEDMALLCTAVGFELEGRKCIRYVRLSYRYETPIDDRKIFI